MERQTLKRSTTSDLTNLGDVAFRIVNVDHELEAMGDVDVMRVDVLPTLPQRFWQLQFGLEHELFVLHGRVIGALVGKGNS